MAQLDMFDRQVALPLARPRADLATEIGGGARSERRPAAVLESDTSVAAAESVRGPTAARLRELVRHAIADSGDRGRTCDELEALLDLRHQTASARVNELAHLRLIVDSGIRRPTRSGRLATVWRVLA